MFTILIMHLISFYYWKTNLYCSIYYLCSIIMYRCQSISLTQHSDLYLYYVMKYQMSKKKNNKKLFYRPAGSSIYKTSFLIFFIQSLTIIAIRDLINFRPCCCCRIPPEFHVRYHVRVRSSTAITNSGRCSTEVPVTL